jgi:hypothetical protein
MNAIVRLPNGITQTQSVGWVLREMLLGALEPYFSGFTIRRTDYKPILPAQLPVLGAYIVNERMTPDGDPNAGAINFIHIFKIGFSIVIANNDPDIAEQKLDAAFWSLMNGLWSNAPLIRFCSSSNPDQTGPEGITLGVRRLIYGNVGKNNETPTAELQYEIDCKYRTYWPPVINDFLDKIVVTVIPAGFDQTQTPVITIEYDFSQTG